MHVLSYFKSPLEVCWGPIVGPRPYLLSSSDLSDIVATSHVFSLSPAGEARWSFDWFAFVQLVRWGHQPQSAPVQQPLAHVPLSGGQRQPPPGTQRLNQQKWFSCSHWGEAYLCSFSNGTGPSQKSWPPRTAANTRGWVLVSCTQMLLHWVVK